MRIIVNIFLYFIFVNLALYMQSKILNKKIKCNKILLIFIIILFVIYGIFNLFVMNNFCRFLSITICLSIISSIVFKEKIFITLLSSILQQSIFFISEIICMLIFKILNLNIYELSTSNYIWQGFLNIFIYLISFIFFNFKFVFNTYKKIMSCLSKLNKRIVIFILSLFICSLNLFLFIIYYYKENIIILIANIIFIFLYSIIIYFFFKEKTMNLKYEDKIKTLLMNLDDYEKILEFNVINNHENRNQFLILKSMVKNNKKATKYINEILKVNYDDDLCIYDRVKKIPEGGLRGLIYQKMLKMKELNITFKLNISKNIDNINFNNISAKNNYDICRSVGILLDNAIEATSNNKKEIFINISFDEKFIVEISNYFEGIMDLNKITNKGVTSKKTGHGYGLCLLKKIIENNDKITNKTIIINDLFVQQLFFDIK